MVDTDQMTKSDDLPHGQPGVAEQQRVHRVQQHEVVEKQVRVVSTGQAAMRSSAA
jgi:hypothetical protein